MSQQRPVLYSFRRCPYAMRARLAIVSSRINLELREVVLRDKPAEMIAASPKATVPVLILPDGTVLEESLDVMNWALSNDDPENWLNFTDQELNDMKALIARCDGAFKQALDRYKYPDRYPGTDRYLERSKASSFIENLETRLGTTSYLFGDRFSFADAAILPFIRQFAHVDKDWFYSQIWENVKFWLEKFLASRQFIEIMEKFPQWKHGKTAIIWPRNN